MQILIICIISNKSHVNTRLYAQLQAKKSFSVMMYVLTYRCPQQSRGNGTKGRKVVGEFTTNETTMGIGTLSKIAPATVRIGSDCSETPSRWQRISSES